MYAQRGGPGAVEQFLHSAGYPMSRNWCGEFAAAVVKSQGIAPPNAAAVASNWRTSGIATNSPVPGDVAVRRGPATGELGSHVTFVQSMNPRTGSFVGLGGNQGQWSKTFNSADYEFRHPTSEAAATAQRSAGTVPRETPGPSAASRRPSGSAAASNRLSLPASAIAGQDDYGGYRGDVAFPPTFGLSPFDVPSIMPPPPPGPMRAGAGPGSRAAAPRTQSHDAAVQVRSPREIMRLAESLQFGRRQSRGGRTKRSGKVGRALALARRQAGGGVDVPDAPQPPPGTSPLSAEDIAFMTDQRGRARGRRRVVN
jgi:uncharacterized protein (TIGR02594 family)